MSLPGCPPKSPPTVSHIIHEGDNRANYKSIFHEDVPADVEVINSFYVTYRPTSRSTPDYEIELTVTKQWIERAAKKLRVIKIQKGWEFRAQSYMEERVKERGREWYIPKDISEYESYMSQTSVPYIHMLIDKTPVDNNRYRVFISKH